MVCPHCEQARHLQWYERLGQVEKYAMETNPVYRCPRSQGGCGHIFSPGDHSLLIQALMPPRPMNGSEVVEVEDTHQGVEHAC